MFKINIKNAQIHKIHKKLATVTFLDRGTTGLEKRQEDLYSLKGLLLPNFLRAAYSQELRLH